LQLPAPSQKPEQQASKPALQLQVLPQFSPSEIQVDGGAGLQTPVLPQYPEQQPGQLASQLQVASKPTPLSMQGGGPDPSAG
jgi:hypothetical protein